MLQNDKNGGKEIPMMIVVGLSYHDMNKEQGIWQESFMQAGIGKDIAGKSKNQILKVEFTPYRKAVCYYTKK